MPEKKHLKGVSDNEQREHEHIKESAEESGRYGDRAEDVAAPHRHEAAQATQAQEGAVAYTARHCTYTVTASVGGGHRICAVPSHPITARLPALPASPALAARSG
jgi:hypothetical protein